LSKRVKGILFVDYVRMIKSKKNVDWSEYLTPDDISFLNQTILESEWYPFDAFERMGVAILAIFKEIDSSGLEAVHMWGRLSTDKLLNAHKSILCEGDPRESLMRFQVLRKSFFDFNSVNIPAIQDNYAKLKIGYGMCKIAEEAATYQTLGFFERLLELSGAKGIQHKFKSKSWEGDPVTVLEFYWS
jgi:hypothetical protein